MKNLKSLHEELKNVRHDRQQVDLLIVDYLLAETDNSAFSLVSGIRKISTPVLMKIIDLYLDETYEPTVEEVLKGGKYSMFEFEGSTYCFSAFVGGLPVFTRFNSLDAITPPFTLQDKVKRCF